MSRENNQQQYCANGCGTVSSTEIRFINGQPFCPMCAMLNGQKYENK